MTARRHKKLVSTERSRTTVVLLVSIILAAPAAALPQTDAAWNHAWNQGSPDCAQNPQAPLQVHTYDGRTFVLRENLCSTFEAPFLYLLIGSTEALLIDSGDVADSKAMPLADTVMHLLPENDQGRLSLLVAHTHRHNDHRAGDAQFAGLAKVQVIGFDLESVRRYYTFADWPNGIAQINLGDRRPPLD